MKRIDDLVGATVDRIEVGRAGTVHLWLLRRDSEFANPDWNPIILHIPSQPKKRKAARKARGARR